MNLIVRGNSACLPKGHACGTAAATGAEMTFEQSTTIRASPDELFNFTQDYARRLEWDPFLKSAQLMDGATAARVGARAHCIARTGWGMETEYVSFNPPRACAINMTRGPWFLAAFAGSWRFEETSAGETRVSFRYHLRTSPQWLSWLVRPVVVWTFERDTRRRLAALKDAVERRRILPRTK
jgi:hypothetical protein